MLRDQHDRLELLREERQMVAGELERESQERRQLMEYLEETDPRLIDNLKRMRQARGESERGAERFSKNVPSTNFGNRGPEGADWGYDPL